MRAHLVTAVVATAISAGLSLPAAAGPYADGYRAFQAGDYGRALEAWKPLAEDGKVRAQYGVGVIHERGATASADPGKAAAWYEKAAGQGHPGAQNNLALMYAQGTGVERDRARAVELWQRAAEEGHLRAQFNLGLAYYRARGVAEDQAAALKWFRKAASGGLPNAQYALGQMHRLGIAVPKDEGKALAWYTRAQNQDYTKAAKMAASLRKQGVTPAEIEAVAQQADAAASANGGTNTVTVGGDTDREDGGDTTDRAAEAAEAADSVISSTEEGLAESEQPGGERASSSDGSDVGEAELSGEADQGADAAQTASDADGGTTGTTTGEAGGSTTQTAADTANTGDGAAPEQPADSQTGEISQDNRAPDDEQASSTASAGDTGSDAEETGGTSEVAETGSAKNPEDGVRVWLGSLQTREAAAQHWSDMQARFPQILRGADVHYQKIELDEQGTFFRVLAGPYADEAAARQTCRDMKRKKDGAFCEVHRPDV